MKHLLSVVLLGVVLSGCVHTRITTMRDPAMRSKSYKVLLVAAKYKDLEMVKRMEHQVVLELWKNGYRSVASNYILPPIREYSDSEASMICDENEVDGILLIIPNGSNYLNVTDANENLLGGVTATSHESLNYMGTVAKVVDMETGKVVWIGQLDTDIEHNAYGESFASMYNVASSISETVVSSLTSERLITRAPQAFIDSVNATYH